MTSNKKWYEIDNIQEIISPSLVVYPERIEKNIIRMIEIAGGTQNLRPHIKTYKIAEIIQMQLKYGITKFKCATITEAELLAKCGAKDILLALQPVSVNVNRFFELIAKYHQSEFSTIVDNRVTINEISQLALKKGITVPLWLDINNGMDRTGVQPNKEAFELYKIIDSTPCLIAKGLHVYDGHIHQSDYNLRKEECDRAFAPILELKDKIKNSGITIKTIIAGGTPTFPIHALRKNVEVSPGTPLLWDAGYANAYKDLDFLPAAVLLTRVISKPKPDFICFDLGHKSVASEMKLPRVKFLDDNNCEQISQSEEHLVVHSHASKKCRIGEVHYTIPIHICPTVIKYKKVLTAVNREITGSWEVSARDH